METSYPDGSGTIKETRERLFVEIVDLASYLRTWITTKGPGNPTRNYRNFRECFDSLFIMSSDRDGIDPELNEQIEKYLNSKSVKEPTENDIIRGISLFTLFKKELFRLGVLEFG